jgi:hypothetical protein
MDDLGKTTAHENSLARLLRRMIDLYERDAAVTGSAINVMAVANVSEQGDIDHQFVPLQEQLALLRTASRDSIEAINRKTLIRIEPSGDTHIDLKEKIGKGPSPPPSWEATNADGPDLTEIYGFSGKTDEELNAIVLERPGSFDLKKLEALCAAYRGKSHLQYKSDETREKYCEVRLETTLARFLVGQIEPTTEVLQKLDDTDFEKLLPTNLVAPFRQCHLNVALGNNGTAIILCGVILERALKDLLPSTGMLKELIAEAEVCGLLKGKNLRAAKKIQGDRNSAVHCVDFSSFSSDAVWELIGITRHLVAELYEGRLD